MILTNQLNINGSKCIKVTTPNGSFSVQTNGNIPTAHNEGLGLIRNNARQIKIELQQYVLKHGTQRQIEILRGV